MIEVVGVNQNDDNGDGDFYVSVKNRKIGMFVLRTRLCLCTGILQKINNSVNICDTAQC